VPQFYYYSFRALCM